MSKNIKTIIFAVVGVLIFDIIALIADTYSGIPDAAATKPEGGFMSWLLNNER